VASGVQLEVLRQAVSRRLDGDPGMSSGTWGDRWTSGGDGDGGDVADGERHGGGDPDGDGQDAPATDGAAGHDETSETQAE
jgi:hypothetical protein